MSAERFSSERFDEELKALDNLFEECGLSLGVTALNDMAEVIPIERGHKKFMSAADTFRSTFFPTPLKPAS